MVTLEIQGTPGTHADADGELVVLPNGDLVFGWWGGTGGNLADPSCGSSPPVTTMASSSRTRRRNERPQP